MSPVALLCEIIAQSGKVAAASCRDSEAYGDLVDAGLVRGDGLVQSVPCAACDIGYDAQVVFEEGRHGHFCPESGFVPLERSGLIAVVPDLEVLSAQIGEALGRGMRGPRRLSGHAWHVGTFRTEAADIAVYFQACLQTAQDLHALEAALIREAGRASAWC